MQCAPRMKKVKGNDELECATVLFLFIGVLTLVTGTDELHNHHSRKMPSMHPESVLRICGYTIFCTVFSRKNYEKCRTALSHRLLLIQHPTILKKKLRHQVRIHAHKHIAIIIPLKEIQSISRAIYLDCCRNGVGESRRLQLFPLRHFRALLQFVVVDDVLVGWAALCESVQLVHLVKVAPQSAEVA